MSLARFHDAQHGTIDAALAELREGQKRSHFMWFVFPQIAGLGQSPTARRYAIGGLAEARAYLADPVLAARLTDAARALLAHRGRSAESILGQIDAIKLRSSATLFRAAGGGPEFQMLLDVFHEGRPCERTLDLIG